MDAPPHARSGAYVEIQVEFTPASDRQATLPDDTRKTPFQGWVKGVLLADADVGAEATIRTTTGRLVTGHLTRIEPAYDHTFGPPHPALSSIGPALRRILRETDPT